MDCAHQTMKQIATFGYPDIIKMTARTCDISHRHTTRPPSFILSSNKAYVNQIPDMENTSEKIIGINQKENEKKVMKKLKER